MSETLAQRTGTENKPAGTAPLVSAVMPVFNGSRHIGTAIESVLGQGFADLELIVVDDGSRDGSADLAAGFGPRVRVIRQANQGSAVARNAGIAAARGAYVAFIDADDAWLPAKIETQVRYLATHPDVGLVYHRWQEWNGDPRTLAELGMQSIPELPGLDTEDSGWVYHRLLLDCIVHTSTVMVRRSLLADAGGFDPKLRRGQDYDYWLRLSRLTPMHKLATTLSVYRIHAGSITLGVPDRNYAAEVIGSALGRWGRVGPDGSAAGAVAVRRAMERHWRVYGVAHLERGDLRTARAAARRAVGYWPVSPVNWGLVLKTLLKTG
ncbi:MAG: glycosyltransferase [Gammaproteobacteria bacterium]|nr:glycosyltransferase [Gammaproteobacteria bacterium]